MLVDGLHEAIISEETWQAAQIKLLAQAKKYEHVNKGKDTRTHLLSGIVKCPICGAGMYGNKCIKHKKRWYKVQGFLLLWLQASYHDTGAQMRVQKADSGGTVRRCGGRGYCGIG